MTSRNCPALLIAAPASGQGKGDFTSFSIAFQGAYYWDLSDQ